MLIDRQSIKNRTEIHSSNVHAVFPKAILANKSQRERTICFLLTEHFLLEIQFFSHFPNSLLSHRENSMEQSLIYEKDALYAIYNC